MSKPSSAPKARIPADRSAFYDALIATVPEIERKGAAMAYTSLNGNMFSYMNTDGVLALRLGPADRESFIARYGACLHQAYGIVQKEYVAVPDALLADTDELRPHFAASHRYAQTLRPKPTKKAR